MFKVLLLKYVILVICYRKYLKEDAIVFLWNSTENTELALAVDEMTTREKRIYILMIEVTKLFSFFRRGIF